MVYKVAVCYTSQSALDQTLSLIEADMNSEHFEATGYLTAKELLEDKERDSYALLITDVHKATYDADCFELAEQMSAHAKIVFKTKLHSLVYKRWDRYSFEIFTILKEDENRFEIMTLLNYFLCNKKDPKNCTPLYEAQRPKPPRVATVRINKKEELTVYHDDIFYISLPGTIFPKTKMITKEGTVKIKGSIVNGGIRNLPYAFEELPFFIIEDKTSGGHYIVNLNHYILNESSSTIHLDEKYNVEKTFELTQLEHGNIRLYFWQKLMTNKIVKDSSAKENA